MRPLKTATLGQSQTADSSFVLRRIETTLSNRDKSSDYPITSLFHHYQPNQTHTCRMRAVVELATTSSVVSELVDPMTESRSVPSTFLGEAKWRPEAGEAAVSKEGMVLLG